MSLCSFRRLCGKCVAAHVCVMQCSSQVLEASFHCVTFWHHPGLLALPSAAVKHYHRQHISHKSSTGLLNYNISHIFAKGWMKAIDLLGITGPFMITEITMCYSCSWFSFLCWGSTLFTKEGRWSLPVCLTWLHPCNSSGEKQEWRGSSVTHILFLTHNLLQNHTLFCCSHMM